MDFNTYLNKAWDDHAKDAAQVTTTFSEGLKLVQNADQLAQLGRLSAHVFGEHLGKWDQGISFLNELKTHSQFTKNSEPEKLLMLYSASLALSGQKNPNLTKFSNSEQIRILAMSASSVYEQGSPDKAKEYFLKALDLAASKISKDDPANRSLAVAGNNLACSLEEKSSRNSIEDELMILAAKVARKFWEVAGTWKEVERAEYRLSYSFRQAGNFDESFAHAQLCVEICETNSAPALEFFFGYEALALVEKAKSNDLGYKTAVQQVTSYFEKLSEDDKSWCKSSLEKLS
ncbi:MAG: hypothetical protein V4654_04885 [Bdellovibrionota bacterium]